MTENNMEQMRNRFNGDRTKFSSEELRMLDDIAKLDINYCECYPSNQIHPDESFCEKCELVVPGTDETSIRSLVAITGQFKLLKSKKP
ncbi:hypothetical protein MHTCC0001_32170 [Flavobacteriaceae bacterium MHTCC 0001]